jgi:hypothetical protein
MLDISHGCHIGSRQALPHAVENLSRVSLQSGPRLPGSSSWAGSLPRPWGASHTALVVAACCFRRD